MFPARRAPDIPARRAPEFRSAPNFAPSRPKL
jgi:hypothetical protein